MVDEASSKPDTALTEKILQLIGSHHQALEIAPAPASLRDTLLAVAALLHLEAAKTGTGPGPAKTKVKHLEKAFASAARTEGTEDDSLVIPMTPIPRRNERALP